jgi:hypothetical protein
VRKVVAVAEEYIDEPVVYEEEVVAEASSDYNNKKKSRKNKKMVSKKGKGASKNVSVWNWAWMY